MLRNSFLVISVLMFTAFALPASGQRKSVSGSEATGTFKTKAEGTYRNELKIQAVSGGKIRFGIHAYFPYKFDGEWTANMGELTDEALISGDTAVYANDSGCKLTFKFASPGVVKVTQEGSDGNCGFGVNVTADGTYRKVSSQKPKFDKQ